jgi:hypothetical protein
VTDTIITPWFQPQGAARTNQQAGQTLDTGPQAWPDGVNVIQARMDCTPFSGGASTRFNDPSKVVDWTLSWSFDGGTTWAANGGAELGSVAGTWGKSGAPYPFQEIDFSQAAQLPTHFRAQCKPRTTLNFGVSFQSIFRVYSIA